MGLCHHSTQLFKQCATASAITLLVCASSAIAEPAKRPWLDPEPRLDDALERTYKTTPSLVPASWMSDETFTEQAALNAEYEDAETIPDEAMIVEDSTGSPCLSVTFDKVHNSALNPSAIDVQNILWLGADAAPCQTETTTATTVASPELRTINTAPTLVTQRDHNGRRAFGSDPRFNKMLTHALAFLGTPYRYGGTTPAGFDCSGFVYYNMRQIGISMPRTAHQQYMETQPLAREELQPGDLVFFRTRRASFISHVGIYLGNDRFIHAVSRGKDVAISSLSNKYWNARFARGGRVVS